MLDRIPMNVVEMPVDVVLIANLVFQTRRWPIVLSRCLALDRLIHSGRWNSIRACLEKPPLILIMAVERFQIPFALSPSKGWAGF